jgi:hypothetical protein
MKKEIRLIMGVAFFLTTLLTMSTIAYAQEAWISRLPPVECSKISITPSTVPEGTSFIRVTGSGCTTPSDAPATVIVWTPFGHSEFGVMSPGDHPTPISGRVALRNGSFTTFVAFDYSYPGTWEVYVQIWQNSGVVNAGSGGLFTVT